MLQGQSVNAHRFALFSISGLMLLMIAYVNRNMDYYEENQVWIPEAQTWYAVFGCSTPGEKNHRGYDYAFYLPLTALAWERFGFKSVVQIIGTRIEWERSRVLAWILAHLEARRVTIIFTDAMLDQRPMLGQTARLFTANMAEFAGRPDDFLITTDADLWPLDKNHYAPPPNVNLMLLHAQCCGFFAFNNSFYRMYPMSNIGAKVRVWRQIINEGHRVANDSESIVQYFEDLYGPSVRNKPKIGDQNWYLDQKMVSIRIQEWINRNGRKSVHLVSDAGFDRIDRPRWASDVAKAMANQSFLDRMYDAHLPGQPYLPGVWNMTKYLVRLMYGENRWQVNWAEDYTNGFYKIMVDTGLI